jgi:AcrR family transcriptional regulator
MERRMKPETDARTITRQQKHEDLLRAATKLFATQGIGHTSTRQIAEAAESTERTLFKHFQSKEGLVRAVIAEAVVPHLAERAVADVQALLGAKAAELPARFARLLRARRAAYEENPDLTRLLIMELVRDDAVRRDFGSQWYAQVWEPARQLFARIQADGEIASDISPETLATIFYSITIGYLIGRTILAPDAAWHDGRDAEDLALFFARGAGAVAQQG